MGGVETKCPGLCRNLHQKAKNKTNTKCIKRKESVNVGIKITRFGLTEELLKSNNYLYILQSKGHKYINKSSVEVIPHILKLFTI